MDIDKWIELNIGTIELKNVKFTQDGKEKK